MKRIKPKYPLGKYFYRIVPITGEFHDNYMRKYSIIHGDSLEDIIRDAIRMKRDEWRAPYYIEEAIDYAWDVPENQKKYKKIYVDPADNDDTIRYWLTEDDAKYRNTYLARRAYYVRVPSIKRSNKEWINFYRTFPNIARAVAIGDERFADGAKLKYIPLFKQILDEEWPENLKMWTERQYDDLIKSGLIKDYKPEILNKLVN